MTYRPEILARVQARCRAYRWWPNEYTTERKWSKDYTYIRQHRRRPWSAVTRAGELALIRDTRLLCGPRWRNPLSWAVELKLMDIREATALTILRKLETA